jgi:spermidine synthase
MPPEFLSIPIRGQKLSLVVEVKDHILHRKTEFQAIDIYDTQVFGKILLLDGHVQLSAFDEHAYHESLVHIPLLSLENPQSALVVGGGDGGVLRELCRHKSLERIHMVEIDQGVIDACRETIPEVSAGAFDDPRVTVHVQDAFPFLKQVADPYDLIVMDSTDVYEEEAGGLSEQLFTKAFYRDCLAALSEMGMLVTQADNLVFCPYSIEGIVRTFREVFPRVGAYHALVPSFGGYSGFVWASKGLSTAPEMPANEMGLRYLSPITWQLAMMPLPF